MTATDTTLRIALIILGLITLTCLVGGIIVVLDEKQLPDALIGIGSSSATAVGFIITRPLGGTQDVRVIDEPIEVIEPGH